MGERKMLHFCLLCDTILEIDYLQFVQSVYDKPTIYKQQSFAGRD